MSAETSGEFERGADGHWRFRGVLVRADAVQAWADSLRYGVGVYQPGPATVANEPALEVWRHRDPVEALADDATLRPLTP